MSAAERVGDGGRHERFSLDDLGAHRLRLRLHLLLLRERGVLPLCGFGLRDAPVGFSAIRLSFELETDADEEQLATLKKLTERYCVVYQTLAGNPALSTTVSRGSAAGVT